MYLLSFSFFFLFPFLFYNKTYYKNALPAQVMVWKTNFEPVDQCESLDVTQDVSHRQPLDVTVSVPDDSSEEEEEVTTVESRAGAQGRSHSSDVNGNQVSACRHKSYALLIKRLLLLFCFCFYFFFFLLLFLLLLLLLLSSYSFLMCI